MQEDQKNSSNFVELGQNLVNFFQKLQEFMVKYVHYNKQDSSESSKENPILLSSALNQVGIFGQIFGKIFEDPSKFLQSQIALYQQVYKLWNESFARMYGDETAHKDEVKDRRFSNKRWKDNVYFDYLKHLYLLLSDWTLNLLETVELEKNTKIEAKFYLKQIIEAFSPSNFIFTNPEILDKIISSNGENLVQGINNLIRDLDASKGVLKISLTDPYHYEIGKNIVITEGVVVYKNNLVEIINYTPTGKTVHQNPIFIICPWINRYYILDLRPENSFVKWLVDEGYNVFITSWINPDASYKNTGFDDYVQKGFMQPIDFIKNNLGFSNINVVGYCIGGTMLACGLGVLVKKGELSTIKSATFLTTLIDFSIPGELGIFVNDVNFNAIKIHLEQTGFFDGRILANIFTSLRARELFWNAVVDHYLLGKDYGHFDILHWNNDSVNLPALMHISYLENFYKKDLLKQKGALEILGEKIDLSKVTIPIYFLAAKEDHIVPPDGCFLGVKYFGSKLKKFVLTQSGHVAGVVNPPQNKRYGLFENKTFDENKDLNTFLDGAIKIDESWWFNLNKWFDENNLNGKQADAEEYKKLISKFFIQKAPGEYIKS
jgi:polyhydroxyalkanoate synthase